MAETRKYLGNKSADLSNTKCFEADCNNTDPKALTTFDIICVCISMGTFVADLTTDIIVIAAYWRGGYRYWCMSTLCLVVTSSIVLHIFSLRWHMLDDVGSLSRWITHICQVGIIHRYCLLIKSIVGAEPSCPRSLARLHWQQSDLHMLHLFQAFVQAAPLLLLQLYIMHCPSEPHTPTHFMMVSAVSSCWSLAWAGAAYARGAGGAASGGRGWVLQSSWHCALLAARMSALLMFAVVFGWWTFVPLGIHWGAMTIWIISQKTNFCPSQVEEFLYNCVVGIIYCFCYFNLHSGRTRARLLAFYSIAVSQNLASVLLFLLLTDEREAWVVAAAVSVVGGTIIGLGSMITYYRWFHPNGPISWRRNGEDDLEKNNKSQAPEHETASRADTRSLKTMWVDKADSVVKNDSNMVKAVPTAEVESTDKKLLLEHWIARSCTPTFVSVPIAAPTSPHTTVTDNHSGLEFHTAENTPDSTLLSDEVVVPDEPVDGMPRGSTTPNKTLTKSKRSGICSTTELDLQLANLHSDRTELVPVEQFRAGTLSLQKRRGICSSDELKEDLSEENIVADNHTQCDPIVSTCLSPDTDSSNKKSSDSIDMDLDLSFSDINSSDINEFNENIVQKLCLSTLKNIKGGHEEADIQNIQRIALDILKEMYCKKGNLGSQMKRHDQQVKEVETLSVHDYENICAVNIAREAWGLRSWGCYSDIENWLHDDSVVRDRRSDTFTSASSEISSCISTELRNNILSAPPIPARRSPTYSNVFVKPRPSRRDQCVDTVLYELSKCNDKGEAPQMNVLQSQDCDIFIAKPCMIDQNAPQLHTILEELDEIAEIESARKPRLNSESSLVATIDEIRKGDITNSPRNVYHRSENIWDSPQLTANCSSLKRALWKEPSKLHSNNINFISDVDSRTDKLSRNSHMIKNYPSKSSSTHKSPYGVIVDKTLDKSLRIKNITLDSPQVPTSRRKSKSNKLNNTHTISKKKSGMKMTEAHQLCHGDVAYLARLVSEPSSRDAVVAPVLVSTEKISSSLQSLISKDSDSTPVINNTETKTMLRKSSRNKPRRKFSLLRERFEPKSKNSDEEVLYESSDSHKSPSAAGRGEVCLTRGCTDGELVVSYRGNVTTDKCEADPEEIVIKVNAAASAPTHNGGTNIKDKRTLFLKQVLGSNKMNGRSKK